MSTNRRQFLQQATLAAAGLSLSSNLFASSFKAKKMLYEISLAEWSFHKALFAGKMTNLEFPAAAKKLGINTVEYVNQFFKDKATDTAYLNSLLQRCKDNGIKNHLIMIDSEGSLASTDAKERTTAVENHYKWVDAAKHLGCITIRVNAAGEGTPEDVQNAGVDGLSRLAEYAEKAGLNVIVENHGGITSNGEWLAGLMKKINRKNVGTLPDFGNFCLKHGASYYDCLEDYDRYKGTAELMPYAKGVSAKTFNFDAAGNCVETDYPRIFKIIKDAGFKGYAGIEYEGDNLSEEEGIIKTKALLEKTFAALE